LGRVYGFAHVTITIHTHKIILRHARFDTRFFDSHSEALSVKDWAVLVLGCVLG
jgi:hypothetical protein